MALVTTPILYVCSVKPGHCAAVPVMDPGVDGVPGDTVTDNELGVLVPHVFPAVTVILPFCPDKPVVTFTETVPWPPVIVHPVGTAHVYVVAAITALIL